jgi:hypothetical protein
VTGNWNGVIMAAKRLLVRDEAAMPTETDPLLDTDHATFLQRGVSISVGACDNSGQPCLARATGCKVSDDLRQVTIFISATQAAQVLAAIRANGAIAVVFSQPSTHRTLQLKGRNAVVSGLSGSDMLIVERYAGTFARELAPMGFEESVIRTLLACPPADVVALNFTPAEAYLQTPGPQAGKPLRAST